MSMHARDALQETPLWRFSLDFYGQADVANACLALQDEVGADVNLLLFLLWQATQGRRLSPHELKDVEIHIAPWRHTAVLPLRSLRRALKAALLGGDPVEVFRSKIKSLELEAERLQQAAMYEFAQTSLARQERCSAHEAARANLHAYEQLLGATFPHEPTETLFASLAQFERNREE